MTSAALELQRGVFTTLQGNADLIAAMGEVRLYDQAPANAKFPYLTFGRTSVYDWSTDTESGAEHLVTLHVWSKERGTSECHALIETGRGALDDAALTLDGHALIRLRTDYSEVRYEDDNDVQHGLIRFRALTEAAT